MSDWDAGAHLNGPGSQTEAAHGGSAHVDRWAVLASELLGIPVEVVWLQRPVQLNASHRDDGTAVASHAEVLSRLLGSAEESPSHAAVQRYARVAESLTTDHGGRVAHCAAPVRDVDSRTLGFLCASAKAPRHWEDRERRILAEMAVAAAAQAEAQALRRALAITQHENHRIAHSADHAFVATDAEGRVLSWNPSAERLFGWSSREATGRRLFELILPDGLRQRHQDELARYLASGSSWFVANPVELVAIDHSHSGTPVEITVTPVAIPHGTRFHFAIRDLSGRRESEAAARREQERQNSFLAAIVEQSEDAIVAKDPRGMITGWNRGAQSLYGYSPEEAIGSPVSIIVPPERSGEDKMLLATALNGDALRQFETVRMRKDGTKVNVSLSVSPLLDPDGTVTGASVITRDVTSRVEQERARRLVEEQLRVTIDHAPIGVGLVDLGDEHRGRLLTANSAMASLLDSSAGQHETALLNAVHPDDLPQLHDALTLLSSGAIARRELEIRLVDPDGVTSWVLFALAPVPTPSELDRRNAVIHAMDIGDRKRFEGQLQQLADHDGLTGLFNRRRFEAELTRAVAHTKRYGFPGALLLIDLDGFKYVNDTMGHSYGDELVTRIAALLHDSLRDTDVVARIGGDEFAVIIGHAGPERGSEVAKKILANLREHAFVLANHQQARVTGSIGLTTFDQTTLLSAEELLIEADIAMYQAKEAGKDQLVAYRRDGHARSQLLQRESWIGRLREALETDSFELHAQPIVGICAAEVSHFELLLRLRTPDGDLIRPGGFLHNAERFDLIQQIDRWVFRQALWLLRANHAAGHDIALSVNMSGKTLGDPDILEDLAAMVQDGEIPPDRLIVEVTETAAITNIERARTVARGLRELGCRFALDDFGAGFASFYYLKHLEFDYLKIDGEFVRSLTRNATDQLVIQSVVDIARGLGARTIAESVADDESVLRLTELGVDFGQGYHLGYPVEISAALPVSR